MLFLKVHLPSTYIYAVGVSLLVRYSHAQMLYASNFNSVVFLWLGVADGVGGWRHYGIDSSLFSTALMESCKRFVLEGGLETPSPISVIKAGFQELTNHKEPLFGG